MTASLTQLNYLLEQPSQPSFGEPTSKGKPSSSRSIHSHSIPTELRILLQQLLPATTQSYPAGLQKNQQPADTAAELSGPVPVINTATNDSVTPRGVQHSFITEGSKKRIREITVSPVTSPSIPEDRQAQSQCSSKRKSNVEKLAHTVLEHFAVERSERAVQAVLERQKAARVKQSERRM